MSVPTGEVPVPTVVLRLAAGGRVTPVWRNELGGTTFRIDRDRSHGGSGYVRYSPGSLGPDLADEVARLRWAARWTPVPRVVDHGVDEHGAIWLLTDALDARSAVDPRWLARPVEAARAVGRGLRALHDALPVADCPFDWSVPARAAGRPHLVDLLAEQPPDDRLVVCHGDACVPNTLLSEDGSVVAHVDLGALGVADRWADLAPACWSADFNYGPGHADLVCGGYGVEPDRERLRWYLALWDAEDAPTADVRRDDA